MPVWTAQPELFLLESVDERSISHYACLFRGLAFAETVYYFAMKEQFTNESRFILPYLQQAFLPFRLFCL